MRRGGELETYHAFCASRVIYPNPLLAIVRQPVFAPKLVVSRAAHFGDVLEMVANELSSNAGLMS